MASGEPPSFAEELNAIVDALGKASLIATSLGIAHETQLQEATSELATKNRELIRLNKELQAQLGQVSPLPHPFSCDDEGQTRQVSSAKSPSAPSEGDPDDSEKTDNVSIEKVSGDRSPAVQEDEKVADQGEQDAAQEKNLAALSTSDSAEEGVDFRPRPSVGIAASSENSYESEGRHTPKGNVDSATNFDSAASVVTMTTGGKKPLYKVPVVLRKCWTNNNTAYAEAAATKFSVRVNYMCMAGSLTSRSESMSLKMLTAGASLGRLRKCTELCQIMHPVGHFRMLWNLMCLLFIGYDMMIVPLQVFDIGDVKALRYCEWGLTIWWTLDVLMTFRTGYFVGSRVEMRPRRIARHYLRTWLLCDMVIVVLEWINRFAVMVGSASLMRSSRALRTLRFLKLMRLTKVSIFWKALQEQINSNFLHLLFTITILCGILICTVHFVSCAWYAVGSGRDDGWISYDAYQGEKDVVFWYIASIRWVISQFNGRTDMDERRNMVERLFTCIAGVLLAVLAHAVFISVITKTMLDLSELVSEKTRRRRWVNEFLESNPLPPILTSQVKRCLHEYTDVDHEAQKESKVLAILPQHVQAEVLFEVRSPVLMQNSFFHGLRYESTWAMRFVCRRVVTLVSASKYEVVFDKGDVCIRMLFTNKITAIYGEPLEEKELNSARTGKESMQDMQMTGVISYAEGKHERARSTRSILFKKKNMEAEKSVTQLLDTVGAGSDVKTIEEHRWVSEIAVWSEWRNQGRLVSNSHGFLVSIQADQLASALKKHPDAFALASMYGSKLVEEMASNPDQSDVLPFEVRLVSPIRVVVNIIKAQGLYNADGFLHGKSDPYCVCNVVGLSNSRDARFKTHTIYDSLNPVWECQHEVGLTRHQTLEFQVFDYDFGKADTELGTARLYPDDIYPNGFEGELELTGGGGRAKGSVTVRVELLEWEEEVCLKKKSSVRRLSKSSTHSRAEAFMKILTNSND